MIKLINKELSDDIRNESIKIKNIVEITHSKFGQKIEMYDENQNIIIKILFNKNVIRYYYNDKNQLIHTKDCNGSEKWFEYDKEGNVSKTRFLTKSGSVIVNGDNINTDGELNDIFLKSYDIKGNKVYQEDIYGYKKWFYYNDKNQLIRTKDSDGYEEQYTYIQL